MGGGRVRRLGSSTGPLSKSPRCYSHSTAGSHIWILACMVAGCARIELPVFAYSWPIEIAKGSMVHSAKRRVSEAHLDNQRTSAVDNISSQPSLFDSKLEMVSIRLLRINHVSARRNFDIFANVMAFNNRVESMVQNRILPGSGSSVLFVWARQ
jgi:hypothetical protein